MPIDIVQEWLGLHRLRKVGSLCLPGSCWVSPLLQACRLRNLKLRGLMGRVILFPLKTPEPPKTCEHLPQAQEHARLVVSTELGQLLLALRAWVRCLFGRGLGGSWVVRGFWVWGLVCI